MLEDEFVYWIHERENIRILKESGEPKPWSKDKVFQETYFCNARREDDKVTKYIRKYWDDPSMIFSDMTLCRLLNRIETLENTPVPSLMSNADEWSFAADEILHAMSARGEQIWSGAYIVSTNGLSMSKIDYAIDLVSKVMAMESLLQCVTTCSGAHTALMQIKGLGSFLAAQIVADVKNTKGTLLYKSEDKKTFSAHGPGSLRGLAWLFQRDKVSPKEYPELIERAAEIVQFNCYSEDFFSKFDYQDLQNCLCEFDKYMRVSTGVGRSKRKYEGK